MSFIASMYATPVQLIQVNGGSSTACTAVNLSYTRVSIHGWSSSSSSGFVSPNQYRLLWVTSTSLSAVGTGTAFVTIENFNPRFFRQAFQYGIITIPTGATSGTVTHGLTLGAKAFMTHNGNTSTRAAATLALAEAQVTTTLQFSGAQLLATCQQIDYAGGPGVIDTGYTLIDPK